MGTLAATIGNYAGRIANEPTLTPGDFMASQSRKRVGRVQRIDRKRAATNIRTFLEAQIVRQQQQAAS